MIDLDDQVSGRAVNRVTIPAFLSEAKTDDIPGFLIDKVFLVFGRHQYRLV